MNTTHNPDGTLRAANPAAVEGENADPANRADLANTNPTGRHYHAPHDAGHPRQGAITPNPGKPEILSQDPKFGNLTADGTTTTDGRVAAPDPDAPAHGTLHNRAATDARDGIVRNADGTTRSNAAGTVQNPAAPGNVARNPDGSNYAAPGNVARNPDGTVRK